MKNRKGQLKIQQMTFMILAVTLFFVLVGMFILMTQVSGLKQKAAILQSDNAKLLASKIADSPEFSCGDSYGTGMSSCIDADKVINLKNYLSAYGYGRFWGIQGLQIIKIYPEENNIECTSSNFPNCGAITLIPNTNGTGISNFVSLCGYNITNGQSYAQCGLAKIIVYYQGAP
ncbi:MAG: hypothetical protein M1165_02425 [Candidatus Pacearchaeota archaeon]|nr:hypothetical protein [Candidatus Pacearchaeota archaeon]